MTRPRALLALLPTLLLAAAVRPGVAQEGRLVAFDLRDQFGRRYTEANFVGNPLVLIGCDRGGSAFGGAWKQALEDALATRKWPARPRVVSVADLRGVPRPLRGFVRGKFPISPDDWSLLDWEGALPRAYGFARDACTLVAFGRDGMFRGREVVREVDFEHLERILLVLAAPSGLHTLPNTPALPWRLGGGEAGTRR